MTTIANNLSTITQRIRNAERQYGRESGSVTLLAVSKTQPLEAVQSAIDAGQTEFGENQLQDALTKIEPLRDSAAATLSWHFIGPIQSNKTQPIAQAFDWVHSIDRGKIAQRLSSQRPDEAPPLNVCIQVNVSNESTKSGITIAQVAGLANEIRSLPGLRLRGLMAIPARADDFDGQRAQLRPLKQIFDQLRTDGFDIDTLSMGMTDDLEAAIAEGSTIVRIGTAIFGPRRTPAR
ncbi:MAG: YggS family pyridoxal phosphate-dependent enzyme [Pseudomonadota bacterium]